MTMTTKKKTGTATSAPMPLTQYENLKLTQLRLSSMNPRKTFSDEAIRELSESIRHQGLLQPITVRPIADVVNQNNEPVYEIVCGARRFKAMQLIEADSVPSIIRDMTDAEALDAMIVENLQRKDVDPLEEAEAFSLLLDQGQTVADLALRFGKSERYVRDRCKLNDLVPELREAFHQNKLPLSGAIMLARLPQEKQTEFADDNSFAAEADLSNICKVTIDDVKDFIEDDMPSLDKVSFLSVPEEQWNVKKQPRLCANCPLNSSCQLSLFPELAESAVCGDSECYQDKVDAFARWIMEQHKQKFIANANGFLGIDLAPDDSEVIIVTDDQWELGRMEPRERALYDELYNKVKDKYLIVTLWKNGVRRPYEKDAKLDKMIREHKVIKGLSLLSLAKGYYTDAEWVTVPHTDEETEEDKAERRASDLGCEYRSLDNQERAEMKKGLFNIFAAMEMERDDELQWWERALMAGALLAGRWDDLPCLEQPNAASDKIDEYIKWWENKPNARQEREALVKYFEDNSIRQNLLISLMERVEPESFNELKAEIGGKIAARRAEIESELSELGFDENGHKISEQA